VRLVVRKADGTRVRQEADIPEPVARAPQERALARELRWDVTRGRDGKRRQRPVGTPEQLDAYAKANPFSAHMFSIAERVETRPATDDAPAIWEWVLPDGSIVDGCED
jgi:hypothetical protein